LPASAGVGVARVDDDDLWRGRFLARGTQTFTGAAQNLIGRETCRRRRAGRFRDDQRQIALSRPLSEPLPGAEAFDVAIHARR